MEDYATKLRYRSYENRYSLRIGIGLFHPEKKSKQGGLRIYFFENPPEIFHFFNLTPGNSRQNKAQTLDIIHKIVLNSLKIPRPKTKTPGNSILFFLCHSWKFWKSSLPPVWICSGIIAHCLL